MSYRYPIGINEWYHCFNRGVDKRKTFVDGRDYARFEALLYIGNSEKPVHVSNMRESSLAYIVNDTSLKRGEPLVEIGAYALMPSHPHLVLKEIRENGISMFMQKVFTAYTMYFNKRHERTGALFAGPFKSKHIADDRYFKKCIAYVHMNPVELIEPRWKEGKGNVRSIESFLGDYRYSSLTAFSSPKDIRRKVLGESVFDAFEKIPTVTRMLEEAQSYYAQNIKASP